MEHLNSPEWNSFLQDSLRKLIEMKPIPYLMITPSVLPPEKGVYLISEVLGSVEVCLYVGRTRNLRDRIYRNHLMGNTTNARLKKYIMEDKRHSAFGDEKLAKSYIKSNCMVRWVLEEDVRKRGALEGFFTAKLFPKYGISEEH